MRLFDAIIDANHRALAGDENAGLHPAEFESELPLAALTCIDVRLNPLLPSVLGIPKDQFVWLRNVGNVVDGPMGTMMRALAVACAIKGAKEIVIIGHTDCQVTKTSAADLMERLRKLQIDPQLLPANIGDFFGFFTCARTNVIKGVEMARHSPLVGPSTPIHGLMVDTMTGRVEWVVNGYDNVGPLAAHPGAAMSLGGEIGGGFQSLPGFQVGELKFPSAKIGEAATEVAGWIAETARAVEGRLASTATEPKRPAPPVIPIPPPLGRPIRVPRRPK